MIADVYCAGPSLLTIPIMPGARWSVSVNRAASVFPSDWWVFRDDEPTTHGPVGDPRLFIPNIQREHHYATVAPEVRIWEDTALMRENSLWCRYSSDVALWWASRLPDVDLIRVYGMDLAGDKDVEGQDDSHRDETRWALEHEALDFIRGELRKRGVTVVRIL